MSENNEEIFNQISAGCISKTYDLNILSSYIQVLWIKAERTILWTKKVTVRYELILRHDYYQGTTRQNTDQDG